MTFAFVWPHMNGTFKPVITSDHVPDCVQSIGCNNNGNIHGGNGNPGHRVIWVHRCDSIQHPSYRVPRISLTLLSAEIRRARARQAL